MVFGGSLDGRTGKIPVKVQHQSLIALLNRRQQRLHKQKLILETLNPFKSISLPGLKLRNRYGRCGAGLLREGIILRIRDSYKAYLILSTGYDLQSHFPTPRRIEALGRNLVETNLAALGSESLDAGKVEVAPLGDVSNLLVELGSSHSLDTDFRDAFEYVVGLEIRTAGNGSPIERIKRRYRLLELFSLGKHSGGSFVNRLGRTNYVHEAQPGDIFKELA